MQEEKEAREAEEQSIASARAASTSAAGSTSVRPFSFQTDKRQARTQPHAKPNLTRTLEA